MCNAQHGGSGPKMFCVQTIGHSAGEAARSSKRALVQQAPLESRVSMHSPWCIQPNSSSSACRQQIRHTPLARPKLNLAAAVNYSNNSSRAVNYRYISIKSVLAQKCSCRNWQRSLCGSSSGRFWQFCRCSEISAKSKMCSRAAKKRCSRSPHSVGQTVCYPVRHCCGVRTSFD